MATQEEYLESISKSVEGLLRLSAIRSVEGMKAGDAIRLLGLAGLDRNLIAEICDTSPGTVSVRLSEAKRKEPAKQKRRKGE